ncbi:MAG: ubiquinol-cytochrome c reductase iron-sulfur subunit [Gammaproteobacteria bacterium]|nr:ubiquinol-cytochrome c reductase iron-sulfur subunit [Gammaproteobacteria bacterium]
MSDDRVDRRRRRFLTGLTGGVGAAGAVAAAVPFVSSMTPSERAKAQGAPVEIDISDLKPGEMKVEEWRGKPVWVLRRTAEMLATLADLGAAVSDPNSERSEQPQYTRNEHRSIKPELLVLLGVCTHLGCAPLEKFAVGGASDLGDDWRGGFFCPCHGSKFDLAGRVYKNVPAPTNLPIPPYSFVDENKIIVGVDPGEEIA